MQSPIDAVLQAEQQAERTTDQHRADARNTVTQAMEKARHISERAHRRISNIRTHCSSSVKSTCNEMWRAYDDQPKTIIDNLATPDHVAEISARVAKKLTGARDA